VNRVNHADAASATDPDFTGGVSEPHAEGHLSAKQANPQNIVPGHVVPLADEPAQ
jgi:hypothetical protein